MTPHHARVAIIGGGIYGCGLLYQLVEKGWRDVVLIEKNELGAGSTWHAAGFCTHYTFNLTHGFMRKLSTELYHRLEREGVEPTGYHRCAGIRVTSDADRMDEFRHGLSVGRRLGIDFQMLGPADITRLCPLLCTAGLLGGIFEPIDGYVDPAQATQAMARLARAGGARVFRHAPVRAIEATRTGEWRITAAGHEVIAEHVVVAAGFWANEIGALLGLDLPVVPMLHQYLVTEDHTEIRACVPDSIPLIRFHDRQWYVRRERDGLIVGAYESSPQTWSVDGIPRDFGMELLPADLERIEPLLADALARIPVLAQAGIKTVVHGPVSYTPDGQPLIGPAPGLRNAWIAAGSGFGIGEGAGAGALLAEWIIERSPPLDMLAFDPRRFGCFADKRYRVARAVDVFATQFATHYPLEERAAGRPCKMTPIHDRLAARGAVFGSVYGWERPNWFARRGESTHIGFRRGAWFQAVHAECSACSEHAGIMDLSGFSKYRVRGADATRVLDSMSANTLPKTIGDVRLCHFLNHRGGVECEFTITRLNRGEWYLVCAALAQQHHLDWLHEHTPHGADVHIEDLTEARGVIAIAGPRARELLGRVSAADLGNSGFPWLSARAIEVAGVAVDALRVSYTGELGWELHHDIAEQRALYDALVTEGERLGLAHVGFYAINAMRLEKGYKAWGSEIGVESTPWELGLERFVALEGREFIGRDALLLRRDSGLERRLRMVRVAPGDSDVIGGEALFFADELAGVAVSGGYGHRVGASLAFALLDVEHAAVGTELDVEMFGERRPASVIREPVFDPRNERPRA